MLKNPPPPHLRHRSVKDTTSQHPRLGRNLADLGLNELLSVTTAQQETLMRVPLNSLQPGPFQPRKNMDPQSLEELSQSIQKHGVFQPLVVRPWMNHPGQYEIIAGGRRFLAAQKAGVQDIPVIVHHISDQTAYAIALIENIQRENLNGLEEALALQTFVDLYQLTQAEIALLVGKSRERVSNLLRLLQLPEAIQALMHEQQLGTGHGLALLALKHNPSQMLAVAKAIAAQKLSVRQTEALIRTQQATLAQHASERAAHHPPPQTAYCPEIMDALQKLSQHWDTTINLKASRHKDQGQLVICYKDLKQLESILKQLGTEETTKMSS